MNLLQYNLRIQSFFEHHRLRHDFRHLTPSQSTHYTQERAALASICDAMRTILLVSDERKLFIHLAKGTPQYKPVFTRFQPYKGKFFRSKNSNNNRKTFRCTCVRIKQCVKNTIIKNKYYFFT
jgi:hypothetical protein